MLNRKYYNNLDNNDDYSYDKQSIRSQGSYMDTTNTVNDWPTKDTSLQYYKPDDDNKLDHIVPYKLDDDNKVDNIVPSKKTNYFNYLK